MKEIELVGGMITVVDDDDFSGLASRKWYPQKGRNTYYAIRQKPKQKGKTNQTIRLHSEVIGSPPLGFETDHIDGNGLNNQRGNLRFVTRRQNHQNRHHARTSKYPGVSWHKPRRKWQARLCVGTKEVHLGLFNAEAEAFTAYKCAVETLGERVL